VRVFFFQADFYLIASCRVSLNDRLDFGVEYFPKLWGEKQTKIQKISHQRSPWFFMRQMRRF
jgi:hypothetical protein